jgi:hypothetical protein
MFFPDGGHPPSPKCRTSAHPHTSHTRARPLPASPSRPRHRLCPCVLTSQTTPHTSLTRTRPLRCPSALATAARQHLPLPAPPALSAPPALPVLSPSVAPLRPLRAPVPSRALPCAATPVPSRLHLRMLRAPVSVSARRSRSAATTSGPRLFPQAHPRPLRPYRSTFLSSPPPFPLIYPFPNPFASLSRASTSPAPPLHKLLRRRYSISRGASLPYTIHSARCSLILPPLHISRPCSLFVCSPATPCNNTRSSGLHWREGLHT